ncbi:hypothetical protein M427DRAFT_63610 [Gonapodya prolifera JEL478]|uniref:Uncharacterized protein n=1 Tax=Gonapodya prolifera (strain JEL478) TaxID=1344416 RepID=A0A138ZYW9_GONPJ|nr:hypothetical protein M427DRAFT_63610 [Gonapodya prolifera JEL478]|eukprot:KXS09706.1 hypothetical protein M427DRAFT_63610 [Gonapodya prolifera JEL478]
MNSSRHLATFVRNPASIFPIPAVLSNIPPSFSQLRPKHHYSRDIPADTPRVTLPDGSLFIHRKHPVEPITDFSQLPPALPSRWRKYDASVVLTGDQVAEMRRLRQSDPDTWTVGALSKKFGVPPPKVLALAPLPPGSERRTKVENERDRQFINSTFHRQVAILDRIRKKERW